jgi:hypothetical protein
MSPFWICVLVVGAVVVLVVVLLVVLPYLVSPGIESDSRGLEAAEKGDYDLAIARFTEAIRLDPKLARA